MLSLVIYNLAWIDRQDIPFFQGLSLAQHYFGRIFSSTVFSFAMTSAHSQLVFFACLSVATLLSTFGFSRIYPNIVHG